MPCTDFHPIFDKNLIRKTSSMASAGGERMSSSDFKKKREIENARKNGTLPPEQDADGNLINPHNPEFISKRPWYLGDSGPSLKHQTLQHQARLLSIHEADELYIKGRKQQAIIETGQQRKWRKGACKNCGAMSHKTNECVERPRKVGAWKTNKDLKNDEVVVDVRSEKYGKLAFDAKRDKWLGYNPMEHIKTIERYEKVDAARKKLRADEINKKLQESADKKKDKKAELKNQNKEEGNSELDSDSDYESDMESQDEEFRDHDEGLMFTERVARQGGVGGAQMKTTVRNLRIREDTAKYLRNLNPNSAYYDPKTRSMRDNPNPELNPEDTTYVGDNMTRFTGDAQKLASAQLFAWEAYAKGTDIHPIANPSQAEFLKKQYEKRKAALEKEKSSKILAKYGGQQHLEAPPKELLLAQSEHYVEYSSDGRVIKGRERALVRSKYIEDAFENNHTKIWGSWFDRSDMMWGYACCHSKVRNSYCTGEDGIKALKEAKSVNTERPMLKVLEKSDREKSDKFVASQTSNVIQKRSDMYGENVAPDLDEKKLKHAIKKATKEKREQVKYADKKRKYNSMGNYQVNAEEMEAYKLLKSRDDDPMAKVLGSDVLIDEQVHSTVKR
ncbi:putative pre-mRNA-splicing factor SLU7 domain-containing protein [Plasmopara halstedii]